MTQMQGILPALVTPCDESGCFAARAFERLLERVYSSGVDGVYVCGSTGEGLLQPVGQRKLVAEAAVRIRPGASRSSFTPAPIARPTRSS